MQSNPDLKTSINKSKTNLKRQEEFKIYEHFNNYSRSVKKN